MLSITFAFISKVLGWYNSPEIPHLDIKNRKNNALEIYNRRRNDFVARAHPNICSFQEIIRDKLKY
ncbi:hypothetical protein HZS_5734 [Henneguya salminicola]|nr:hypothetical protein HZS_5734 [Henneguya salminicola]